MNVDWIALQDRLTAAEKDVDGLIVFVAGFKSALSIFCAEMGSGAPIGFDKIDWALTMLVSPRTLKRLKELEAEGVRQRGAK